MKVQEHGIRLHNLWVIGSVAVPPSCICDIKLRVALQRLWIGVFLTTRHTTYSCPHLILYKKEMSKTTATKQKYNKSIVSKTDTDSALQIRLIQTKYLWKRVIDFNFQIST